MSTPLWTAHLDPATGDTYYANTQTLETTWIRPSEYRDPNEQGLPPEIELEDNWVQILDPGTQRYYFANRVTNEVTWTPPNVRPKKMGGHQPLPLQAQAQAQPQQAPQPVEEDPIEAQKERERLERMARAEAIQRKQEEARAAMVSQALGSSATRFTTSQPVSQDVSTTATPGDSQPGSGQNTPRQPYVGGANDPGFMMRNIMLGAMGVNRLKKAGTPGTATPGGADGGSGTNTPTALSPATQVTTIQPQPQQQAQPQPQPQPQPQQISPQTIPAQSPQPVQPVTRIQLPQQVEPVHDQVQADPVTPVGQTTQPASTYSPSQTQPQSQSQAVPQAAPSPNAANGIETPRAMPAPPPRPAQDPNAIVHDYDRVLDKTSGQYYYVHKQTLQVQWEIPESYKLEALQRAQQQLATPPSQTHSLNLSAPISSPGRGVGARLSNALPPSLPIPVQSHSRNSSLSNDAPIPSPTTTAALNHAMGAVTLGQPDASPRLPVRGKPPPLPPSRGPPPSVAPLAAAGTPTLDPRPQPAPPSMPAPQASTPVHATAGAGVGMPGMVLPAQTYAQPQATQVVPGYGQIPQGVPARVATPEIERQQERQILPPSGADQHRAAFHHAQAHAPAPVPPPAGLPPQVLAQQQAQQHQQPIQAQPVAVASPQPRGPARPPPPIRNMGAAPTINPQAPSNQLPVFSPPAQSPAHHLTPQQLAEQQYKQSHPPPQPQPQPQAFFPTQQLQQHPQQHPQQPYQQPQQPYQQPQPYVQPGYGAPTPTAQGYPQPAYGTNPLMSPTQSQPQTLPRFQPGGPYIPPGATNPLMSPTGSNLPPSARPMAVQVSPPEALASPHAPGDGRGSSGATPHHGSGSGSTPAGLGVPQGEVRSSSIIAPQSAPAAPSLPKGVYLADNGLKILPAPIRADIQKFQMDGFAAQHFREFRQKTGLVSSKRVPVGQMVKWQNTSISQSLLNSAKKFSSVAVTNFENILNFMGDKPSKKQPSMLSIAIVNTGIQKEPLRDEIYCQLCKQTNDNPDAKSNILGWKLMAMCVSAFAPTRDFQNFILKHFLDNYNGEGDVGKLAPWCYYRMQRTIHEGPDPNIPTLAVIDEQLRVGVRSYTVMFNGTLEYILQLEKAEGSNLPYPRILPVLCDAVIRCGGFKVKGIFRLAANKSEIHRCRDALSLGKYDVITSKTDDPHTPADLLKIWLRELSEPLIPMSMYESCLKVSDNRNDCIALLNDIPLVHFRTLEYLLTFLAELAKSQAVTAMTEENIAIVFCTDILRTDEKDPAVLFRNSPKEKNFVRNLILAWGQGQILTREV